MTVRTPRRPSRRQAAALVVATGAVVAGGLVASASGGAGASGGDSRTTTAQARDLLVTDDERGTLARADTTTVLYDGTGGRVGGGPPGSAPVEGQAASTATVAQIDPCDTGGWGTSTSSTSTTACPSTTSTTTTSTTSTTTTTTTTIAPPTTDPPAEDPPEQDPPQNDPSQPEPDDGTGRAPEATGPDGATGDTGDTATGSRSATLTELLAVGDTATRGSILYRADDEPIVALLSTTPLFRELRVGVDDGADVRAIESELQALGYGGFTVDEHYDSATAAAVKDWEEALGRGEPDGVVTVGEVQLLDEPTAVLEHRVSVGDLLEPGDAVLVLGAESRVVEADVEASEQGDWAVGTNVSIDWGDGTTTGGSITEVGRDVVDGQVDIVVALADGSGADRAIGSRVDLVRTVADRRGVLAVPVSAVVGDEDSPGVRVVGRDADRIVPVELGVVDDGWVEVTAGLDEGTKVRLPG